jgi:hypothetical protein
MKGLKLIRRSEEELSNEIRSVKTISNDVKCARVPLNVARFIENTKKVKLSLCFNRAARHGGILEEWRYSSTDS